MRSVSFGREKFKSFLLSGTAYACTLFLTRLVDSVIAGRLIGEDAFAGVNMVAPVQSIVFFVAYLIAMGTATNYLIWMGRMDRFRARGFFLQGLWMALLAGGVLSAVIHFGEDGYLLSLDGSEYVEMYARQYLDWYWPTGLTNCLLLLLSVFCCADGDFRLVATSNVFVLAFDFAISYVAVDRGMGASGCSLGAFASDAVGILLLCTHFFRKVNTFAPVRRFSLSDAYYIVRASFGEAMYFLCNAVLFFTLNKLIIAKFDSDLLPIASLAIVVWRVMMVFGGIALAVQPIVTVYWGERNTRGIRKVMQLAWTAAAAGGLLACLTLLAFPQLVLSLAGVEYPDLLGDARTCVRFMSFALVPLALVRLFTSYYLYIERPLVSVGLMAAGCLVLPLGGALAGSVWGLGGVWLGLAAGPGLGLLLLALLILARRGRSGFPLLLPRRREEKIAMFDFVLEPRQIVRVSEAVAAALPRDVAPRAALVVEEVFMAVRERNAGRRRLLGEVTLDLNDGVLMTLRDDGVIFDITDADAQVSSLRAYLIASVMHRQSERMNILTTGFNRNVFRFA